MALAKTVTHSSGVEISYWRITKFVFDGLANSVEVVISGYTTHQARDEGKQPICDYRFFWSGADNPVTIPVMQAGQAYMACYIKIITPQTGLIKRNPSIFEGAGNA